MIEVDGSLLEAAWETLANEMANADDIVVWFKGFDGSEQRLRYGFMETVFAEATFSLACFAMDTRSSGPALLAAAIKGCKLMGVEPQNFGVCSTPQLHWLIANQQTHFNCVGLYVQFFKQNFLTFLSICDHQKSMLKAKPGNEIRKKQNYTKRVFLDCANGVAASNVLVLTGYAGFAERLEVQMINDDCKDHSLLNAKCGAEYVHLQQSVPTGFQFPLHAGTKWVSFDGDADRQIYFYTDADNKLHIIDGDK
jgi:phosphoacetylglucosamine mutase